MIIRQTEDHHFYVRGENTPESKFLDWRLSGFTKAKDKSYTIGAQDFMTLMRKMSKARLVAEEASSPQEKPGS